MPCNPGVRLSGKRWLAVKLRKSTNRSISHRNRKAIFLCQVLRAITLEALTCIRLMVDADDRSGGNHRSRQPTLPSSVFVELMV